MKRAIGLLAGVAGVAGLAAYSTGQAPSPPAGDALRGHLARFVGTWKGAGDGNFGKSVVETTYGLALKNQYLHGRTRSVAQGEDGKPGEVHEDWTMFSIDRSRKVIVLRQFNSEGYVNTFVLTEAADDGRKLKFVTEHSENSPPGLEARLIYTFTGDDRLTAELILAKPGQEAAPCVTVELKRV